MSRIDSFFQYNTMVHFTYPDEGSDTFFILNTMTRHQVKSPDAHTLLAQIDIGIRMKKFCRGHNLQNESNA